MNRPLLLLLLLLTAGGLLCPAAARAQTAAGADTLDTAEPAAPATPAATLRQARQLVLERRYDSAWRLLTKLDPRNLDPAVVIEKADLALRYYTATDQLRRFAFRDLKLLDLAPDSLRLLPSPDSLRYRFAVRQVLERLQRAYPSNYRLARALGDYYYTVQQCDCAEEKLGEDEVFLRTITEYQEAHAHGQGDYLSYFALGYAYQRLGKFESSLAPFERSLELRPRNPTAHLNLAFVLLELRQLEKAREQARLAQQYFTDSRRKDDAGFLLKEIEARIRQTSGEAPAEPAPPAPPAAADTTQTAPPTEGPPAAADAADESDAAAPEAEVVEKQPAAVPETPAPASSAPAKPAAPEKPAPAAKSKKSSSGKSPVPKTKASQQKKPQPPEIKKP
ncbi:tetratricopeptide repeat protein [Hymenobacter aerophilus]|uniref:tetratricopeptide repeat protein n=1 Tax=Hymenobacter aerophilus TaxID=119644 RepID=UPI0003998ABE|nr:tetratricopeptide repeat protein [Hymenobacter aerophilus]